MADQKTNVYYRMGYATGQKTAQDCQREILNIYDRMELSSLGGLKLYNVRQKSKTSLSQHEQWGLGFYDGWMDFAMKLNGYE